MPSRPPFLRNHRELRELEESLYPGSRERLGIRSPLSRAFGLKRIGVHVVELPPGRRASWPYADSDAEELIYVIEGKPDAWIDGTLYPLEPGDAVGFPATTGIAHTFLNNTRETVRLIVVGELDRPGNRRFYPLNQERRATIGPLWWGDAPNRKLGTHDGLPDRLRQAGDGPPDHGDDHLVTTPRGATVPLLIQHASRRLAAVIAPGRRYDMRKPLLERCADQLARAGFMAVRFDWAGVKTGELSPDLRDEVEDLTAVVAHVREQFGATHVLLVGKSLGAAVVARAAPSINGVIGAGLLTPPMHVMNHPDQPTDWLDPMLDLACPLLIAVGDADPICSLDALVSVLPRFDIPPRVVVVPGDHTFGKLPPDQGRVSEDAVAAALGAWAQTLGKDAITNETLLEA